MTTKWRILTVDDEPDVRMIIKTTLEPRYEVVEAHDGLDALEKISRYEPDFVLMDVMMPMMNGFEACAAIRKDPLYRELPVMFLSALGGKEDMMKGYATGANLYLTKPFDPTRLQKNIDVFFEKTPPARKTKRFTIAQIHRFEEDGLVPESPGSTNMVPIEKLDLPPVPGASKAEIPLPPSKEVRLPAGGSRAEVPLPPLGPASGSREAVPTGEALGLPRVMVVDDQPEVIELMRMTLAGMAEVVAACDGMDAIEKLVRYQPDILVVDVMLPKMNGFQLVQSLRANRAFGRLPILMCSGRTSDRDVNFAKRAGANDYLPKPFSPLDLMQKFKDMTRLPGFRVRPKTLSYEQIVDIQAKDTDVFKADESTRQVTATDTRESAKAINKFLSKEGTKDALKHTEEEKKEEPKKKRFFGFGG